MPEFSAAFSAPPKFSGGVPEKYFSTGWAQRIDPLVTKQILYQCATISFQILLLLVLLLLASMTFPLFMLLLAPMILYCTRPASSEMEITKNINPFVLEITNIWQKSGRFLVLGFFLKIFKIHRLVWIFLWIFGSYECVSSIFCLRLLLILSLQTLFYKRRPLEVHYGRKWKS